MRCYAVLILEFFSPLDIQYRYVLSASSENPPLVYIECRQTSLIDPEVLRVVSDYYGQLLSTVWMFFFICILLYRWNFLCIVDNRNILYVFRSQWYLLLFHSLKIILKE